MTIDKFMAAFDAEDCAGAECASNEGEERQQPIVASSKNLEGARRCQRIFADEAVILGVLQAAQDPSRLEVSAGRCSEGDIEKSREGD